MTSPTAVTSLLLNFKNIVIPLIHVLHSPVRILFILVPFDHTRTPLLSLTSSLP